MHYLGIIAFQSGRHELAENLIRGALALDAGNHAAQFNLAEIYRTTGRLDEAEEAYRRALQLKPEDPLAHFYLGHVLRDRGQFNEAVTAYRRGIELNPENFVARLNLGNALKAQGLLEEAIETYRGALELKPDDADALNNLGATLKEKGEVDEAIAALRRAVELQTDHAEAQGNLGAALAERGEYDEAMAACRRALELKPEFQEAKYNYSLLLLLRGDFEQGWPFFESRGEDRPSPRRHFSQPRWNGKNVAGKRILIHAEQGLGDSIQFIRYAKLLAERGAEVLIECQRALVELFRSAEGVSEVFATGEPLPRFDCHLPMLSLPLVFRTTAETIPRNVPYLFAEPVRREIWRNRLGPDRSRLRVGIAWASNAGNFLLGKRHVPLEDLHPIMSVKGADFISLQVSPDAEQLQRLPGELPIADHTKHLHNFAETAALMAELDLIISVDTAVAHLAGALGMPVWTLLPFSPDWRWGLGREDTQWYPTMRLFRQPALGDWTSVIPRVAEALQRLLP
jgi:tetratricopeptide (TPR) repeat protein